MEQTFTENIQKPRRVNPLFPFMAIGSVIYSLLYTIFLYKNGSGITYPFFVGGTCLFFFLYLRRLGVTAKKDTVFFTVSLMLLGISTCLTDSWSLHFFNKLGIFLLLFCMMLHCLYHDESWDLPKYIISIVNLAVTSPAFIMHPFRDLSEYRKRNQTTKNSGKIKYVVYGFLIAVPLLIVILFLLASADIVFASLFDSLLFDWLEDILIDGTVPGIFFTLLFSLFAPYLILSKLNMRDIKEEVEDKRNGEPVMAITFTSLLSFVYLIFCMIQIIYLFAGFGTLPYRYTYAEYARQGFFQLVFVCLINLFVVLICMKRFRRNNILKGLLTFISLCTYIMIASSIYKMLLYIAVYYLTFLRLFVLWALLVIFFLMTGVLILIYKEGFPYFKFLLVTVTVLYLIFSLARPDYWIAAYNISHMPANELNDGSFYKEGYADYDYFCYSLSLDAAPAIYSLAEEKGYSNEKWLLENYSYSVKEGINEMKTSSGRLSLRKWNLSRWTAYQYYEKSLE